MSTIDDGKGPASAPAAPAKPEKAPSPKNCRNFIRKQTADAMPKIVATFVKKAEDGSVPHFTSLAKVGGFDQRAGAAEAPKKRRTRSLARQLLDEVELYEARVAAERAAEEAQAGNQVEDPGPKEHS